MLAHLNLACWNHPARGKKMQQLFAHALTCSCLRKRWIQLFFELLPLDGAAVWMLVVNI
jgi:hypothetical protein